MTDTNETSRVYLPYERREYYPGQMWGNLTLEGRDLKEAYNGNTFHGGYWIATCKCGATVRVHSSWLRSGVRRGRTCPRCSLPGDEKRKYGFGKGRQPLDLEGKVFGRLTPIQFVRGSGWICKCGECGGELLVTTSAQVAVKGMRKCRGECVV